MSNLPDPTLMEMQANIFGLIFLLSQYLAKRGDEDLEPLGLTTKQWLLLAILVKRFPEQAPTLSEAASCYGSSHQNVKKIAQQLEQRGYLNLQADSKDRRILRLQLTPKIAAFEDENEVAREAALLGDIFSVIDIEEQKVLQKLVQKLVTALSPNPVVRTSE